MRNFQQPGRSASYADGAMIATSHPAACDVGRDVLKRGGSAADAVLAASAVLCVAEPQNAGLGGDSFYIHASADGHIRAYNGSGRTPMGLRTEALPPVTRTHGHAVIVPGAVDSWVRLHEEHGRLPWDELLQPAISLARNGVRVTPRVAWDWAASLPLLMSSPTARARFAPGNRAPAAGDLFFQPELAMTLERIARHGRAAFYEGELADSMARTLREAGGAHDAGDFAAHSGLAVTPIRTGYRGWDVLECPPPGQGMTVLMMLNIFSGMDVGTFVADPVRFHHLLGEATRLAYAERDRWCADPSMSDIPLADLLSPEMGARLRGQIDYERAAPVRPSRDAEHRDTVYIAAVDRDGNALSFINSIFTDFGSAILDPLTGVLFNDRGTSFSRTSGHPNLLAPGKRPMHTIIPGLLTKAGRPVMPFGVMGGHYQATGQVQLLLKMLDGGLDPQEALEEGRSFAHDGVLELETGLSDGVVSGLERMGHEVVRAARPMGGGQAVWIDHERGFLIGGSDPRKDGYALGF